MTNRVGKGRRDEAHQGEGDGELETGRGLAGARDEGETAAGADRAEVEEGDQCVASMRL